MFKALVGYHRRKTTFSDKEAKLAPPSAPVYNDANKLRKSSLPRAETSIIFLHKL